MENVKKMYNVDCRVFEIGVEGEKVSSSCSSSSSSSSSSSYRGKSTIVSCLRGKVSQ